MKPSQLRLEEYFFEEVSVYAHTVPTDPTIAAPAIEARRSYIPDAGDVCRWQVRLEVELAADDDKATGYTGRIVVRGAFSVGETTDTKMRDFLITNGAPALLYGAAREMLLTITGRGPHQHIMLPSVIFHPEALPLPKESALPPKRTARTKAPRKAAKKA